MAAIDAYDIANDGQLQKLSTCRSSSHSNAELMQGSHSTGQFVSLPVNKTWANIAWTLDHSYADSTRGPALSSTRQSGGP